MIDYSLLHINSYFITNSLHCELIRVLDKKGLKQVVFIPVGKNQDIDKFSINELVGTNLIYRKSFNPLTRYLWPLKVFQTWKQLNAVETNYQHDIIHAHSLIANGILAYLNFLKRRTSYIVSIRNTDINLFLKKSYIFRKLSEIILKNSSAIIFLTPYYKEVHLKKYISKSIYEVIYNRSFVIPNGISSYWFDNLRTTPKIIEGNILNILFVGKLNKNKNIAGLVATCKLLRSENIEAKLIVVGDGPLKSLLLKDSTTIPIHLHGYISDQAKLLQIYRESHILLVPSFYESFGLVYLEAMSQGLPIIYSKGQGIDGWFKEGHIGYSVDPHDENDIAENVKLIIKNYRSLSANAIKEVVAFNWDRISERLISVYDNIINNTK